MDMILLNILALAAHMLLVGDGRLLSPVPPLCLPFLHRPPVNNIKETLRNNSHPNAICFVSIVPSK